MKQFWIFDFGFSIGRSERKKIFCLTLCALLFAFCLSAEAQQAAKIPRVGILFIGGRDQPHLEAFKQGLRERGYMEGKNIVLEYRYAEGKFDRVPALVDELVRMKVDIIVTTSSISARAARKATKTIDSAMPRVAYPNIAPLNYFAFAPLGPLPNDSIIITKRQKIFR